MDPQKSYEEENLRKHNIRFEEVEEVLASDLTYYEELKPSERGNDRLMFVGWTQTGRILEVGIEYFDEDDREHVFHAMDANVKKRRQFIKAAGLGI